MRVIIDNIWCDVFEHCKYLAIDNAHSIKEGPGLWTRFRWVKPGVWAQLSHYLCLQYMWQVYQYLYQMYNVDVSFFRSRQMLLQKWTRFNYGGYLSLSDQL